MESSRGEALGKTVVEGNASRLRLKCWTMLGIARRLPLICANPDLVRVSPQGTVEAPGVLAQRYEALGGRVFYHGKPYPAIYRSCLEAMPDCTPERVVTIGDSMEHDVLGSARAGLASVFVAGGIHADRLVARWGEMPEPGRWRRFVAGQLPPKRR